MKTKLLRKLRKEARKIRVREYEKISGKGYCIASKDVEYNRIGSDIEFWEQAYKISIKQKLKCIRGEYILDKVREMRINKKFKEIKKL